MIIRSRWAPHLSLIVLAVAVSGCATVEDFTVARAHERPDVHVEFVDVGAARDPASFTLYRWEDGLLDDEAQPGERVENRYLIALQGEVDRAMEEHGFTRSAATREDVLILAVALTVERPPPTIVDPAPVTPAPLHQGGDVRSDQDAYDGFGLRWVIDDARFRRVRPVQGRAEQLLADGTLHLGAFSPDGTPLWHAMAHQPLSVRADAGERTRQTRMLARALMRDFPSRR